eukprot:scaffold91518_cov17-Prasinocladus_malaysianus.AAC.1
MANWSSVRREWSLFKYNGGKRDESRPKVSLLKPREATDVGRTRCECSLALRPPLRSAGHRASAE